LQTFRCTFSRRDRSEQCDPSPAERQGRQRDERGMQVSIVGMDATFETTKHPLKSRPDESVHERDAGRKRPADKWITAHNSPCTGGLFDYTASRFERM